MLSAIWYYLQSLKKRVKYLWRSDAFIKVKGVCIFTFFYFYDFSLKFMTSL